MNDVHTARTEIVFLAYTRKERFTQANVKQRKKKKRRVHYSLHRELQSMEKFSLHRTRFPRIQQIFSNSIKKFRLPKNSHNDKRKSSK